MTYYKDWEDDENISFLSPKYNAGLKRYALPINNIVDGLNQAGYLIDGEIIEVPDGKGGRVPLPDRLNDIIDNSANSYRLEIFSSNGNVVKDPNFKSILSATLYKNNRDITHLIQEKYFKWTRKTSDDPKDSLADAEWNLRWSQGAKQIPITSEDIKSNAIFNCFYVTENDEIMWVRNAYNEYKNLDYYKQKQADLQKKEEFKNAICKFK